MSGQSVVYEIVSPKHETLLQPAEVPHYWLIKPEEELLVGEE